MIHAPRHPAVHSLFALSLILLGAGTAVAEPDPSLTICCQDDAGNVSYTSPRACKGMGGVQVSDDLCREVCCALPDGTVVTTTLADCHAQGGAPTNPDECLDDCDCVDDDGDGVIDEDLDCTYDGFIDLTVDDAVTGVWVNGVQQAPHANDGNWQGVSTYGFAVVGIGPHTVAFSGEDVQNVAQGALARVFIPGIAATYDTGFGAWLLSHVTPPANWFSTGSGLTVPDDTAVCPNPATWGGIPGALAGAAWVWAGGCDPATDPRQQFAFSTFRACVPKVCCADADGNTDFVDADLCPAGAEVPVEDCLGVMCEPIQCPPGAYYPVDTDGDGCDDACWIHVE